MKHLLVTNDFPPKVGGIQNLLWEWWRRLPSGSFAVLTSPHKGAEEFDSQQPFLVKRTREPVLLPHPWMIQRIFYLDSLFEIFFETMLYKIIGFLTDYITINWF